MSLPSHAPQLDRHSVLTLSRVRLSCITLLLFLGALARVADLGLSRYAMLLAAVWLAISLLQDRLYARSCRQGTRERIVFSSLCIDSVVVAGLIGFTGGAWWCGPVLFAVIAVTAASMLPPRRVIIVGVVGAVAFSGILVLLVTGVLPSSAFLGTPSMRGAWAPAIGGFLLVSVEMCALAWTQRHMTLLLRQRATRYRALMDTASDLLVVLASDGGITHVNQAVLALAQCERTEVLRDGLGRLLVAEDVAFFRSRLPRALEGEQQTMMLRARAFHGVRWLSCTLAPMMPGHPDSDLLAILRDVTDDRLAMDTVRYSEARLRAVFNQAAIAIAMLDLDGCFLEVNPSVERLLGFDSASLIGRPWTGFSPPEDLELTTRLVAGLRAHERDSVTIEQRFVRADGRVLWTLLTLSRVDNPTGPAGLIAMLHDISERRALEAQLTWQAFHDPLTNLANRALFRERVESALSQRGTLEGSVAVLFLDLDNFKTVNDSMGHAAGDQLLFEVGRRLLNATRGCDTVARLGGDEFAILVNNVRVPEDCIRIAERVLHAMQQSVALDVGDVAVSASIGIVRDASTETADDLLRNADVAMYNAKKRGRGRFSFYESGMHDKAVERLRLMQELQSAIENNEITLVYQPIVTLADSRPCGFEALARWTHPEFGAVPPTTFIPLAEETGLIVTMGATILRAACEQAVLWNDMPGLPSAIGISVNLSGRQLEDASVIDVVRDALVTSTLDPARLTLEITETALVTNSDGMRDRLYQLKELGVTLAIDDFGTGYSSLSYIQQFPVDVLKIDRSFVEGLARPTGTDAALARTIIALGSSLQLRTVAEGIEIDAQRAILRELGCDYGQGYLYARPLAAGDVGNWLADALGIARPPSTAPRPVSRPPTEASSQSPITAGRTSTAVR